MLLKEDRKDRLCPQPSEVIYRSCRQQGYSYADKDQNLNACGGDDSFSSPQEQEKLETSIRITNID